ncbi:MAG: class I SAM-dependent methyltransferase [Bacilli bacterium]|nr:class I SAM-dependent methyltransferase [Bacilli bacterium]MDD4406827.1 class I SAM-dependent methyltransferase [Bacilli bacterium]
MLSNRLKSIAGLVQNKDKVMDIGCDHALLGICLVKNNILNNIVVSDINQKALDNAIKNIKKYKLQDKIDARLGNGISVIDKNINTIIISGLGTNTIIKILSHPNLKQIKKLIIQSNNDHYLLRKYLVLKEYYITHESIVYDKGHYYINIVFEKGKRKYTFKELMYGPFLIYANKDYFEFLLKKKRALLENIPKYKITTIIKHKKEEIFLKRLTK